MLTSLPQRENSGFLGREDELIELEALIRTQNQVVLVNGLGGLGKTEVCRRYFWDNFERGQFVHFAWIDYLGSLKESFVTQFQIGQLAITENETTDQYFTKLLHFLANLDPNSLIIIDNIDDPEDPDLPKIRSLPFKVIANSRMILSGFEVYPLRFLSLTQCKELFVKHYKRKVDEILLEKMIELSGFHTLSVELLAKTARSADLTVQELLDKLTENGFNLSKAIPETVRTNWHEQVESGTFLGHLQKVFEFSNIDEDETYVLANLSVLPAVYVGRTGIVELLKLKNKVPLNSLVEKGWLQQEDSKIFCHQVIQQIIIQNLKPSLKVCKKLINSVADKLYFESAQSPLAKKKYVPLGQSLLNYFTKDYWGIVKLAERLEGIYFYLGQYSQFEMISRRIVKIYERKKGKDHTSVAGVLINLGESLRLQSKYSEAESIFYRSLRIVEAGQGKDHLDIAVSLNYLALVLQHQGRYSEAETLYHRALEIHESKAGDPSLNMAKILHNLATLYTVQDKHSESESFLRRAQEIFEAQVGSRHRYVMNTLNERARLLAYQGKYSEAELLFRRILEIYEAQVGHEHPEVATILNNLGKLLVHQSRYSEAEALVRRAMEIRQAQLGKDDLSVASSLDNLVDLLQAQGKYVDAEPLSRRSLDIRESQLGPDHPDVASSLNNLGFCLNNLGRHAEAESLLRKAVKIYDTQFGSDHPKVANALVNLASVLKNQGSYTEALSICQKATRILNSNAEKDTMQTEITGKKLDDLLIEIKQPAGQ